MTELSKSWRFESSLVYKCGVEQWLARRAHNPKVVGSNPTPATKIINMNIEIRSRDPVVDNVNYDEYQKESSKRAGKATT